MDRRKIIVTVGTRPEAVKMAPLIKRLQQEEWAECRVLATAQHRGMLDQVLRLFEIEADIDLDIMQPNQSLPTLTSRLITRLDEVLEAEKPDVLLAQGDTTTVLTAALACFYRRIPFGHVEAGLRTGDLSNPFPEEMNRVVASRLSRWHFAPTQSSRDNLLKEGIEGSSIYVTGNTVIDALFEVAERCDDASPYHGDRRLILVTSHRRENFGEAFGNILRAVKHVADNNPDVHILYPVHPNPNVRDAAYRHLSGHERITLCEPLDYLPFVAAMKQAYLILTDSGGVQEEAPALAKPVLVMRRETERPEAVTHEVVKLVGTDFDDIVGNVELLLNDPQEYKRMARGVSPYGDGLASGRIVDVLKAHFGV
ncbi:MULTISPECIES: non-hydrolyzing UDP-N-acetylglucosamine 2-epimerase [unclassified Caballeronia]|uniref:non-hydrolyzing UDP-N-acetylglucosamine 2-epimerase n=1 Tax=unclassified Caballeronia TaxID=2646786 RepID=UPI00285CEBDC|nr:MULTISPECIES: UDP-N-acetylglucosamine 2-epimerase (non-hydrolyzing) [unclassified Caballeronia]MDR5737685.1 UDP-N-acetylglucosamine 2-epimerase (non-hydrolyzing) [Caballeronia sp. LZ016]MDR5809778.1 UDP-N-acetylglucosamine 2-epimerase (non-hydrolyzing) [Caballeronia sp. LZ019]